MAQCGQSAQDFIASAFPAMVGALASEDAEAICRKNDLSFVELIRPFCQLDVEAQIHDPVNPAIVIPVKNWKIRVVDVQSTLPPSVIVNRVLREVVDRSVQTVNMKSQIPIEKQINARTPWYEAYRDCYFQLLQPMKHEFFRDYLACILVVSTKHPDPMNAFAALSSRQNSIQHSADKTKSYRWFDSSTFRYYLLLHDASDGDDAKAEAVYQSLKSVYGSHTCFLLQINSRQKLYPNAASDKMKFSDPWSQHIYPFSDETLDIDEFDLEINNKQPEPVTNQKDADRKEEAIVNELETIEKQLEANQGSPRSLSFNDPLTSMHYENALGDNSDEDALGPLSKTRPQKIDLEPRPRKLSERTLKIQEVKKSLRQFSYSMVSKNVAQNVRKERGHCMTLIDQDKIRAFIYEFVVRGLLPHIEKLMRNISEQILARRGIHKSIFHATKKWFGGSKQTTGGTIGSFNSGSNYQDDSAELQYRKLGDLSFLVQHYELAYNSFHSAKREFNNDHAWLYFAGALEMAAVSAFMHGSFRVYPVHYFEACISTYLNTCRLPELATRACLLSTEALKLKDMYPEAAVDFIKLTNEDSDLRSALLLEQAAHCYLHNSPPMLRKFAFHMILAGHRFSKSLQRKHTLRCYINALQIYDNKGWHLAQDHVNFIVGRQSFNLGNLTDAQLALKQLLCYESQQSPSTQASYLREFLAVFKQNLESSRSKLTEAEQSKLLLPTLQLPIIDHQATRCLLSMPDQIQMQSPTGSLTPTSRRSRTIYPGSYTFQKTFSKTYIKRWSELEQRIVKYVTGSLPYPFKSFSPCLSSHTDNKSSTLISIGEQFAYEVLCLNPLKIPLNLLDLTLLWEFLPKDADTRFTNKEENSTEHIWVETFENFQLQPAEKKPVCLRTKAKTAGQLRILGIKYTLSSIGVTSTVDEKGHVELTSYQGNALKAVGMLGMQPIEVKGPRLNSNKQQRSSKIYGIDKRMELTIVPSLPLLKVTMKDIPVTLLSGEVQTGSLVFQNFGDVPLKNLYVLCSHPQCFSFSITGDSVKTNEDVAKRQFNSNSSNQKFVEISKSLDNDSIIKIPLVGDILEPSSEMTTKVFIHGMDTSGVHEIDFLFYYEPFESINGVPYRLVQQTVRLQTLSTLMVTTDSRLCYSSTDIKRNESVSTESTLQQELLLTLTIENRAQGSMNIRCVEFTLKELYCYSSLWKVQSLVDLPQDNFKLRPGEMCMLHLKATLLKETGDLDNMTHLSTISLSKDNQIQDLESPQDLFIKTSANLSAVLKSIGLVLFWETFYIDEGFTRNVINGQSHVIPGKSIQNLDKRNINPNRRITPILLPTPSHSISVSYEYQAIVKHDFNGENLCIVPVTLKCYNNKETDIEIEYEAVDLYDSESRDGENLFDNKASDIIHWVGHREGSLYIKPNSSEDVTIYALISTVGIYEIQNIHLYTVTSNTIQGHVEKLAMTLPKSHCISVEGTS